MTNHTTDSLDRLDQDYERRLEVNAAADVVFEALTSPPRLAAWWTHVTGDGLTGGELAFSFGPDALAVMRVDAAEPDARVAWTCTACHVEDWVGTRLHFDIAPLSAGSSELRFRHEGLNPRLECYTDCKSGWDHFIPSLRAFVETGSGHPNQSEADIARRRLRAQLHEPVTAE